MKPTAVTYAELQQAYDTFNRLLFDNKLPECLITLQRTKSSLGYFSAERFSNHDGEKTDEIAMNPTYFAVVPLLEIMQTMCHEMAHLEQHHFGTPGRGRYHNVEWANRMESVGLMPSSTGQPGGKKTGDHVADYPIEGGRFLAACEELLTQDFKISWYDRFSTPAAIEIGQNSFSLTLDLPEGVTAIAAMEGVELAEASGGIEGENKSHRSKYTCSCEINLWGKPGLNIICGDCGNAFGEIP
jgi:predicted SprT family Zn-dependent metalloprotease